MLRKVFRFTKWLVDLARLWLHHSTTVTKICSVNGVSIRVEASNRRELSRSMSYATKEPDTLAWIDDYMKPGDVLYDIGANIGQYSLYAGLRHRGKVRVYSFEPESQSYAALNRNIYINHLSGSVVSFCLAISESTRIDDFNIRRHLRAGGSKHQFGVTVDDMGVEFSPTHRQGMFGVSLDDLHFLYGLDFPQCIKIDVDGLEAAVIQGGRKVMSDPRLRSVLIEITQAPSRQAEANFVIENFERNGFTMVKKIPARVHDPSYPSYNFIFHRADDSAPRMP